MDEELRQAYVEIDRIKAQLADTHIASARQMEKEDVQKLVEEILSLQLRSSEAHDDGDYGLSDSLEKEAYALEMRLNDAGYTLDEDSDNLDIIHVRDSHGERYGSFDMASWT